MVLGDLAASRVMTHMSRLVLLTSLTRRIGALLAFVPSRSSLGGRGCLGAALTQRWGECGQRERARRQAAAGERGE